MLRNDRRKRTKNNATHLTVRESTFWAQTGTSDLQKKKSKTEFEQETA